MLMSASRNDGVIKFLLKEGKPNTFLVRGQPTLYQVWLFRYKAFNFFHFTGVLLRRFA